MKTELDPKNLTLESVAEKTDENMSIEIAVSKNPSIVLLDRAKFTALYDHVKREVEAFVPDLTTDKGRKAIAALAYKVSRTKTAIDDAGAALKSEWLKKSQLVDASRREIREKLDELREQARRPLTEWETAEETRQAECAEFIENMRKASIVLSADTSEQVAAMLRAVEEMPIDPAKFQDTEKQAIEAKGATVAILRAAVTRIQQEETDRIELAKLRAESEARAIADKAAAEAAELARLTKEREEREAVRLAELAEAARIAEEQRAAREATAIAQAAKDAEEKARREAEAKAKAEADRIEAEHRAEMEKARKAQEDAERKLREEAAKVEAEKQAEAARKAKETREAEAKAEADRKLAANKKHRAEVIEAAESAIIKYAQNGMAEISPAAASSIVAAIVDGKIPNVELRFV